MYSARYGAEPPSHEPLVTPQQPCSANALGQHVSLVIEHTARQQHHLTTALNVVLDDLFTVPDLVLFCGTGRRNFNAVHAIAHPLAFGVGLVRILLLQSSWP